MAGENVEIAAQCLNINARMQYGLGAIHQRQRADVLGLLNEGVEVVFGYGNAGSEPVRAARGLDAQLVAWPLLPARSSGESLFLRTT